MKIIEKIDTTRKYTTDHALSIILDKVNELVDVHNHIENISTLVADVDSLNATVTTLTARNIKK